MLSWASSPWRSPGGCIALLSSVCLADSRDLGGSAKDGRPATGWLAWAGFLAALVALLRFLGPLGGWLTLLWVIAVSVAHARRRVGSTGGPRTRTVRST